MNNKTFLRSPLNLTGMSKAERKAYQTWITAEEDQIRRVKYGRITPEVVKYHDRLDKLCKTLCER